MVNTIYVFKLFSGWVPITEKMSHTPRDSINKDMRIIQVYLFGLRILYTYKTVNIIVIDFIK